MKKIFIIITLIVLNVVAIGQVGIQSMMPAVGLIQKNQLWNVLVLNSSAANYKFVLEISLRDRSTGLEVLTASSGQFDMAPGTKQLNAGLLNPIQYNYLSGGIDTRIQGLLPAGTYVACYQLVNISLGKAENFAEECIQFDADPLSPPMLIIPADSSVLQNLPAQFSWLPPTPAGMFNKLRYELLITEIKEGQQAAEALQDNIPFYNDGALYTGNMVYPASSIAFEKEKWYAWQVTARDEKAYAGKSEVWVFKIGKEVTPVKQNNDSYIFINSNASDNNIFYITKRELFIKYYSFNNAGIASIIIKSLNGTILQQRRQKIVYGDNFFKIPLSKAVGKGQFYKAEIAGQDNKTHAILFSISE